MEKKLFSEEWVEEAVRAEMYEKPHAPRCNEGCPANAGGDHIGCEVAAHLMAVGEYE